MANSLFDAAAKGNTDRILTGLANGEDVNATDSEGKTPLMIAARRGQLKAAQGLLEKGANPNRQATYYGWTAITYAAQAGHAEVVRLLLRYGADPNIHGLRGKTALMRAVENGHYSTVRVLLDHGVDPDSPNDYHGWIPLHRAVQQGYAKIAQALIEAGANADGKGRETPFTLAEQYGHSELAIAMRAAIAARNRNT